MAVIALGLAALATADSITSAGNVIRLVNDAASPGNSRFYGTDSGGSRGWFALASVGVTSVIGTAGQVLANGNAGTSEVGPVTLTLATALVSVNSVTSVAGQNLVLAVGTGGTALTITTSTLAATFAGTVTATGLLSPLSGIHISDAGTAISTTSSASLSLKIGLLVSSPSNSTDAFVGVQNTGGPGGLAGDLLYIPRSSSSVASAHRWFGHTSGTIAERMSLSTAGILTLTAIIASTSTTTGTLVVSGGLGVAGAVYTGSTLNCAGTLAVGSAPLAAQAAVLYGVTLSGVSQFGLNSTVTYSSSATTSIRAVQAVINTAVAAFTCVSATGVYVASPSLGAGSAVTNLYGLYIESQSSGATLNYAIYTNNGIVRVGDSTASVSTATGALVVSGGVGIAGNLYTGGLNIPLTGSVSNQILSTLAATQWSFYIAGAAGAARDILLAGLTGFSNGFTVQYDGTKMLYGFATSTSIVSIASTVASSSTTTGALVVSGGVGIASALYVGGDEVLTGDLTVNGGNVVIGGTLNGAIALYIQSTALTSATQYGMASAPVFNSAATGLGRAGYFAMATAAASFTMTTGSAIFVDVPTVGAASAITTQNGLYIANQGASGITNAYGVDIAAQSGASTLNIGLRNAGTTQLNGGLGLGVTSTATAAGTTTLIITSTTVQIFTGVTTQTVQLPAAAVMGAGVSTTYIVANRSTGSITLQRAGSDVIGGSTTYVILSGDTAIVCSNGVDAWIIA